jgi:hypothetical protein
VSTDGLPWRRTSCASLRVRQLSISLARSIVRLRISRTMTGRSIWLPHGAWPARNRKWHFGLYLPVSADHDVPERPIEVRIYGELRKLGIAVAQSTVAPYLPRPGKPPCQTLRTFLTNHLAETAAIDFFTVPTATFRIFCLRRALAPSASSTALRGDEHPGLGWFCTPFAHISRTLTFFTFPLPRCCQSAF